MTVERYSDSASAFVVLDSDNMPVYKQLFRAAKAKSKLKLRVSVIQPPPKSTPRPVTVEDAPEASAAETYEPTEIIPTESDASQSTSDSATEMPTPWTVPSSITLLSGVELPLRPASPVRPAAVETATVEQTAETPVPESQPANFAQSAPFDPQTVYSSFQEYCDPAPAPAPAPIPAQESSLIITPAPFAVCCNNCEKTVADVHYHCQTCDDGDFDLCQTCVDQAASCYDENHWLIKRTMIDGQLVASSTEKIEPKAQAKKLEETPVQEESIPAPEGDEFVVKTTHIENASVPSVPSICMPIVAEPLDVMPAFSPRVPFVDPLGARWSCLGTMRTCNCCVQGMFTLKKLKSSVRTCCANESQNFPRPTSSTARPARISTSAKDASPRMPTATTPSMPLHLPLQVPSCLATLPSRWELVATRLTTPFVMAATSTSLASATSA